VQQLTTTSQGAEEKVKKFCCELSIGQHHTSKTCRLEHSQFNHCDPQSYL